MSKLHAKSYILKSSNCNQIAFKPKKACARHKAERTLAPYISISTTDYGFWPVASANSSSKKSPRESRIATNLAGLDATSIKAM